MKCDTAKISTSSFLFASSPRETPTKNVVLIKFKHKSEWQNIYDKEEGFFDFWVHHQADIKGFNDTRSQN